MNSRIVVVFGCVILSLVLMSGCDTKLSSDDSDDGGATVTGTLRLPGSADGRIYVVVIDTDTDALNGLVKATSGTCGSGTTVAYSVDEVPGGTYYLFAAVFISGSPTQGAQSGDYVGFYLTGGTIPTEPNASIPVSGTVVLDIDLIVRP